MSEQERLKQYAISLLLTTQDRSMTKGLYFLPTDEIMTLLNSLDDEMRVNMQRAVEETANFALDKAIKNNASQAIVRTTIHINGSFFKLNFSVIERKDKRFAVADLQVLEPLTLDEYLDTKQEYKVRTDADPLGIDSCVEEMVSILQYGAKSEG